MCSTPLSGALFNATAEPALFPSCALAFSCPTSSSSSCSSSSSSYLTWGCVSATGMCVLALCTLLLTLVLGCSGVVRTGSGYIQAMYAVTLAEAALLSLRFLALPDDRLVIAAEALEAGVMVATAWFLAWIAEQLYREEEDVESKSTTTTEQNIRNQKMLWYAVAPLVCCLGAGILATAVLALSGVLGSDLDCHRGAWIMISSFRTLAVAVSVGAAVLIHNKLGRESVSEAYRQSKTRLVWFVVGVFLMATLVELGNDVWGAVTTSSGQACYAWAARSISDGTGGGGSFLVLRICVRTVKYFVPMWSIVVLFRALLPARHDGREQRTMSWASHMSDVRSELSSPSSARRGVLGGGEGMAVDGLGGGGGGGWGHRPRRDVSVSGFESSLGSKGGFLSGGVPSSFFDSNGGPGGGDEEGIFDGDDLDSRIAPLLSSSPLHQHSPPFVRESSIQ